MSLCSFRIRLREAIRRKLQDGIDLIARDPCVFRGKPITLPGQADQRSGLMAITIPG